MQPTIQPFTTLEEVAALVQALEQCEMPLAAFHHREHLAVAFWYSCRSTETATLKYMRSALCNFLQYHGRASGYDEETTRAWLKKVRPYALSARRSGEELLWLNRLLQAEGLPPGS
jgi:hypothetical protein